ncbi:MAG: Dabb family protein [Verrucomicrobiales bacterium]
MSMVHAVYFWLVDDLSEEDRRAFSQEGLQSLTEIDVVESGIWGSPAPTTKRPVTDHSFDYCLILRFASIEDQDTYQTHPEHNVFVERFSPWFKQVKVYDSIDR